MTDLFALFLMLAASFGAGYALRAFLSYKRRSRYLKKSRQEFRDVQPSSSK
jgi:hypothetical protein